MNSFFKKNKLKFSMLTLLLIIATMLIGCGTSSNTSPSSSTGTGAIKLTASNLHPRYEYLVSGTCSNGSTFTTRYSYSTMYEGLALDSLQVGDWEITVKAVVRDSTLNTVTTTCKVTQGNTTDVSITF